MGRKGAATDLKRAVAAREAGLRAFRAWEEAAGTTPHAPSVFEALGFLYSLLPEDARRPAPDPERRGIRRMHRFLAVLGASA
ncbi:MAG: hypothetical protein FJ098_05065 [Deltaproteobacteria bacterium]|nr:hypothetical protein [Deltaproteobacteria bacterium]